MKNSKESFQPGDLPAADTHQLESIRAKDIEKVQLLKPFSDNRPWDEIVISAELKALVRINEISAIEIGKRLVFAKNNIPEGRWLQFVEETGLSARTAQVYMRAARLLADKPRVLKIASGREKLDLFASLDPEDLDDFERSGTLFGKDEDDLAILTRAELKALVRQGRTRLEQAKEQVRELNGRIEKNLSVEPAEKSQTERLDRFRRELFQTLGNEMKELQSGRSQIAMYCTLNLIMLECALRMRELETSSEIGGLLMMAAQDYTCDLAKAMSLEEYTAETASQMGVPTDRVK